MAEDDQIRFSEFQSLIRTMYMEKDVERGIDGTFMWLMEEVGELAAALRSGSKQEQSEEFADVLVRKTEDDLIRILDQFRGITDIKSRWELYGKIKLGHW